MKEYRVTMNGHEDEIDITYNNVERVEILPYDDCMKLFRLHLATGETATFNEFEYTLWEKTWTRKPLS